MWGLKSREEGRMGHLRILQEYYIIYTLFYLYIFILILVYLPRTRHKVILSMSWEMQAPSYCILLLEA